MNNRKRNSQTYVVPTSTRCDFFLNFKELKVHIQNLETLIRKTRVITEYLTPEKIGLNTDIFFEKTSAIILTL